MADDDDYKPLRIERIVPSKLDVPLDWWPKPLTADDLFKLYGVPKKLLGLPDDG